MRRLLTEAIRIMFGLKGSFRPPVVSALADPHLYILEMP